MVDEAGSSAPTEGVANLHLDEVTGEKVSKSELKKRQKLRLKEEEKKKKEAAAPPKPVVAKKENAEADEKELNPNVPSNQPNNPFLSGFMKYH
jgi:lysyl-tRNA synthetase class 2